MAILWLVSLIAIWATYPVRHRLQLLGVRRVRHQRTKFDPPAWLMSRGIGKWCRHRPRWLNRRHPMERTLDLVSRVIGSAVFGALIWLTLF